MWVRNEAQPVTVDGVDYRSVTEYKVGAELKKMGVEALHECPVDGIYYLPDYTVLHAPEEYQFPRWIEVKPAPALWALRDHFDLPAKFDGVRRYRMTWQEVGAVVPELGKPKRLAEEKASDVLVVSEVNRHSILSVLMQPDHVVLDRGHPGVNWAGECKRREREAARAKWEADYERRRAEMAEYRAEWNERQRQHRERLDQHFGNPFTELRPARYPGTCYRCGSRREAADLLMSNVDGRWYVACREHVD